MHDGVMNGAYFELVVAGGAHWHSFLGTCTYFSSTDFDPEQEREKYKRGKEGGRKRQNNIDKEIKQG